MTHDDLTQASQVNLSFFICRLTILIDSTVFATPTTRLSAVPMSMNHRIKPKGNPDLHQTSMHKRDITAAMLVVTRYDEQEFLCRDQGAWRRSC
jgi:hypothetical protein